MAARIASCFCGALRAECDGEPVRVSVCHCLNCKRRSGSAFSAQARFPVEHVRISGPFQTYVRTGDSGRKARFRFCPNCGSTVAYENEGMEGVIAVPLGAFEDGRPPSPWVSVYEERKAPWVEILGTAVEHID